MFYQTRQLSTTQSQDGRYQPSYWEVLCTMTALAKDQNCTGWKQREHLIGQGKFHPVHCASWEFSEKAHPGQSEAENVDRATYLSPKGKNRSADMLHSQWEGMAGDGLSHLQVYVRNVKVGPSAMFPPYTWESKHHWAGVGRVIGIPWLNLDKISEPH